MKRGLRGGWRSFLLAGLVIVVGALPTSAADAADWARWTKRSEPVFAGEFIASDPAIVRDGALYRMFCTCIEFDRPGDHSSFGTTICEATSRDGFAWTNVSGDGSVAGVVLHRRAGAWDEDLEAAFVIRRGDEWLLYYSGYRHGEGDPVPGFPAALGVARSTDGVHFDRVGARPILAPTAGWYDNDAVYSPTIIEHESELVMIYAGHCYTRCDHGAGVRLLAATSQDGLRWTKRPEPVLSATTELDWTRDGVAEPGLLVSPDGAFYLFFTGLRDDAASIGIARGAVPFGPWEVNPDPIVVPSADGFDQAGILAPDVHLEDEIVRMWFLGATPEGDIAIGYAEARWPLWS